MLKWIGMALAMLAIVSAMGQTIKPETKAEKDKRMDWWREARLGMFIHWGLYSIPAGQYNGQTNYGEWIREEAHIPVGVYENYKDEFNPVNFNADAWVKMAHDAGMKYITITTKHHDGFNLFDSPLTDWNIAHTPFKRDIMAEMAAACKKYGVKMCWYHSIMDWHHPDYLPRRSWETEDRPADGADFRKFVKYLRDEVSWLLTHYGPIGVMWFDGEWESTWNPTDGDALYALCRQLQPNVIVNNRVTVGRAGMEDSGSMQAGDFTTPEQFIPPTGLGNVDWETCMTMNEHWGYNSHDTDWKSSKDLIHNIVDIASKGGNYLLNIGPRADGTFPPEAVTRLHDIGDWMKVHGDSIYGTKASVFDKLPWGRSTTRHVAHGVSTLYLQVFDWPKDGVLVVPGVGNEPLKTHLMDTHHELKAVREGPNIVIHVGPKAPNSICSVIELEIKGEPVIYKAPHISADSDILVNSVTAHIDGVSSELKVRYTTNGAEPDERSQEYYKPILIDKGLTLRAASFHHGKRVSAVSSMVFSKVKPKPSTAIANLQQGILCEEYKGSWDVLPDFEHLTPRESFVTRSVSLMVKDKSDFSKEENWGRRFSGYLRAPEDGVYVFALGSDDGSRLWIDGELVIDNDGLHGAITKTGRIALSRGPHKLVVGWFNKSGGLDLSLQWAKSGGKLMPISGTALGHVG